MNRIEDKTCQELKDAIDSGKVGIMTGFNLSKLPHEEQKKELARLSLKIYMTDRLLPLLYNGTPEGEPVLTVANYCKWYDLYLVNLDGSVTAISFEELIPYSDALNTSPFWDHVPNPEVVAAMCEARGWWLHDEAHEMMIGRYELEVNS